MEEYVFSKTYKHSCNVENINNVLLDHEFKNELYEDGVRIKGTIYITFIVENNDKKDYEALQIPVDLFISLNKIDCLKDLKLTIDNFKYEINKDEIIFKVYAKLMGNNEEFICFEPTKNKEINHAMMDLLMRNDQTDDVYFDENYLSRIECLIKKEDVDLITTPFENIEFPKEDIIEISSCQCKENDKVKNEKLLQETQVIETKENTIDKSLKQEEIENKKESVKIINEDNINLIVTTEETPKQESLKEEQLKEAVPNENIKKETNKVEELFKEQYVSKYFYYRVKNQETIQDIMNLFSLKEEDILKLNPNCTFKKGQLIKLPK